MIYDCFSFFNELDLLEIRLNTLDKVVDKFVISESHYTHTGHPKPLYFKENIERFAKFKKKIIHVISPDPEDPSRANNDTNYAWLCENRQRNSTIQHIQPILQHDDTLIISDLDEIPNPTAIVRAARLNKPVRLRQKMYYYYLNYRCCTSPFWDTGTVVIPYHDFANPQSYINVANNPAFNSEENIVPTATKARALRGIRLLKNGGWHYSYMGGVEKILQKLNSIVEGGLVSNINEKFVKDCIHSGKNIFGQDEWFFAEATDSSIPEAALNFPDLIFPTSREYLKSVRLKRILAYAKWIIRPVAFKVLPHNMVIWLSQKIKQDITSGNKAI